MSYVSNLQSLGVVQPSRFQERYGISEESFNEIKRLTSEKKQETKKQETINKEQLTLSQSVTLKRLAEELQKQKEQFEHYKSVAEMKFSALSKDLLELTIQLKESKKTIEKLKDQLEVAKTREALIQYNKGDKKPLDKPIDRNGVAPKDVMIEKIFNFSNKRI